MDSRCFWESKFAKKEEKDSGKTKSTNCPSADVLIGKSTYQSQTNKKDQDP